MLCGIHHSKFLKSALSCFERLGFHDAPIIFVEPLPVAEIFLAIVHTLHRQVPLLPECLNNDSATVASNHNSVRVIWQSIGKIKIHLAVLHRHNIPNFAWPQPHLHALIGIQTKRSSISRTPTQISEENAVEMREHKRATPSRFSLHHVQPERTPDGKWMGYENRNRMDTAVVKECL